MYHFTRINPRFQNQMRLFKAATKIGISQKANHMFKLFEVSEAVSWMSYGKAFGLLGNFEITCHCGKQNTFLRSFRSFFSSSASIQSFGQISHIVWGPSLYKIFEYSAEMFHFVLPWIRNFISNVYIRIPNRVKFDKTNSFVVQSVIPPTFYWFKIRNEQPTGSKHRDDLKANLSWIDKSTSKISCARSTVLTCRNWVRINISVGFVGSGDAHLS